MTSVNTDVAAGASYPPTPTTPTIPSQGKAERRKRFEKAFEDIRDELVGYFETLKMPQEAVQWWKRNLEYNVPGGKLNRGLSVVDSCRIMLARDLTEDEEWTASVLGWCVELLQAYFLVADDMMDASVTRRGQPCYYRIGATTVQVPDGKGQTQSVKLPPVGAICLNDSLMLEGALYHLIKRYFRKERWYVDVLELIIQTTFQTEIGQLIDLITAPEDDVDLARFSLEKHRLIVTFKTSYYSFYLPVALAMHICGVQSPHSYLSLVNTGNSALRTGGPSGSPISSFHFPSFLRKPPATPFPGDPTSSGLKDPYGIALDILLPLGEYFQVQDDYLDGFGTAEQIGKVGTDIVDNKCSWLVCTALSIATPEQRAILDKNYGVRPTEAEVKAGAGQGGKGLGAAEARIKELYKEMKLEQKYFEYQENVVSSIRASINEIDETPVEGGVGLKKEVFTAFLDKIYGRTK